MTSAATRNLSSVKPELELQADGRKDEERLSACSLLVQTLDDHGLHGHQKASEAGVGGFEFAFVGGGAPVVVEQPPESERYAQDGRSDTNNDRVTIRASSVCWDM